jgi:hypothetical protein
MVRNDLEKIKEFAHNVLRPMEDEIKELQLSKGEEINEFCKENSIEKTEFNEAWRRHKKDVSGDVDLMEEAMRGVVQL